MYEKVMSHPYSYVEIIHRMQMSGGRFPRYEYLLKTMPRDNILKHSAWVLLNRKHGYFFVENENQIIEAFTKDAPDNVYFPDEGIFSTTLAQQNWLDEMINACILHTNWYASGGIYHYKNITAFDI